MVFHDEPTMITDTNKSSSESKPDACFHPSCSHCDVNFFQNIKSEIKQLTNETELLKCSLNDNSTDYSHLPFETQRLHLYSIIDEWKSDRVDHIAFIYQKKKNQIDFKCSQTFYEYEIYRIEQKSYLNENLLSNQSTYSRSTISNEIDELNQKLSLTRHLLDYFIQPKTNYSNKYSDSDDETNQPIDYEDIFQQKPINEYPLQTDNLAMACSNSHMLLRDGARLLLFNQNEKLHQLEIKVQHPGDFIRDICWCEALGYYLVLTQYLLFLYDPNKYTLTIVDKVKSIDQLKFSSLTCSDNIMFLVNGNGQCIERWSIAKSFNWKLIKRWHENEFCHDNFRLASRIRANHLVLALNICDRNFGYRICLYDYHMKFLRKINCDFNLHLLSYMYGNQWLATDYKERFYLFNDHDDKIQSIIEYTNKGGFIRNICRLSSNSVAVKIMNRLQIYRISI